MPGVVRRTHLDVPKHPLLHPRRARPQQLERRRRVARKDDLVEELDIRLRVGALHHHLIQSDTLRRAIADAHSAAARVEVTRVALDRDHLRGRPDLDARRLHRACPGRVDERESREGPHRRDRRQEALRVELEQAHVLVVEHAGEDGGAHLRRLVPGAEEECREGVHDSLAELVLEAEELEHRPHRQQRKDRLSVLDDLAGSATEQNRRALVP